MAAASARPRVAVAYSGGRDSTALLHATAVAAVRSGIDVVALHVHHGLSPSADDWLVHCRGQCSAWAERGLPVSFAFECLAGGPAPGDSVEAWARDARRAALRRMALAQRTGLILLAHHRRDQAETWLLQALRGAGARGLASMPRRAERDGIVWCRPWLDRPTEQIDAYVREHRLEHIEDDSNRDPRFARNRLRLQVWPALTAAFGQADVALAHAAAWSQHAAAALDELAVIDLPGVATDAGLDLASWARLSTARRANVLRAWLAERAGRPVPATLTARLLDELTDARSGARWPLAGGELRLGRGVLRHVTVEPGDSAAVTPHGAPETLCSIRAAGIYPLPGWGGALEVRWVEEGGVPLAWLARLELKPRAGAERFQAGIGRPPRSLKKQYQAAGVPQAERGGPLLFSGGQLVYVPRLGIDARLIGLPGQEQVDIEWRPRPAGMAGSPTGTSAVQS